MRMIARASRAFALASFRRQRTTLRSWRRKLSIKKIECLSLKPVLLAQAERQEAGGRPLQYLNEPTRRKIWPDCSTRHAEGRTRDVVDSPDLPGEGDDERGVSDELERGRQVQTARDDGEGAVAVDLHERARVRLRRRTGRGAVHSRA